jgi:hypothetical protein
MQVSRCHEKEVSLQEVATSQRDTVDDAGASSVVLTTAMQYVGTAHRLPGWTLHGRSNL